MIHIENNSLSLLHTINAYGRDKQNQGSACGEEENQPLAGRPTGRNPIYSIKMVHQFITTRHSNSPEDSRPAAGGHKGTYCSGIQETAAGRINQVKPKRHEQHTGNTRFGGAHI